MTPTEMVLPLSEWHSIRPWSTPLALSVREITSVSATFILSSSLTSGDSESSLAYLRLVAADSDSDSDDELESKKAIIVDALAKGLSVNVNEAPWQRVLIRIDDKTDEAVIIIYGLMPGRQYDIDLGLVQGGQSNCVRRQVVTEDSGIEASNDHDAIPGDYPPSDHASFSSSTTSRKRSSSSSSLHSSQASHPTRNNQAPASPPITIDEYLQKLQHTLSLLTSERDTLTASLKSARRDSQKADAALRSEIDILKRASEKHSAAEHRAKQKVLALQEAVRRAQAATKEIEETIQEVEAELPSIDERRNEKEGIYRKVKEDVDHLMREREKESEKERRRMDGLKTELTGLGHKLDKLNGKKEKLEGNTIIDMEEQLMNIEREVDKAESDTDGYGYGSVEERDSGGGDVEPGAYEGMTYPVGDQVYSTHFPAQWRRNQAQHAPGTIGRPSPAPIQRPSNTQNIWTPPRLTLPLQNLLQPHQPQRQTTATKSPTHIHPQPALFSNPAPTSSSSATSPTPSAAQVSTLSSRAAPFEPSQSLALKASFPPLGYADATVPVRRPRTGVIGEHTRWGSTDGTGLGGSAIDGGR